MSHRAALTLSIILTLVLAAGIVAGRDRLFTAEAASDTSTVTPAPTETTESEASGSAREITATGPRLIEIPLPAAATDGTSSRVSNDDAQTRGDDRNATHERSRHGEGENEEEGDD